MFMNLQEIKQYPCPEDEEDATLLVDVETETVPQTDAQGNLQYYCEAGLHTFSVTADDTTTQSSFQSTR